MKGGEALYKSAREEERLRGPNTKVCDTTTLLCAKHPITGWMENWVVHTNIFVLWDEAERDQQLYTIQQWISESDKT